MLPNLRRILRARSGPSGKWPNALLGSALAVVTLVPSLGSIAAHGDEDLHETYLGHLRGEVHAATHHRGANHVEEEPCGRETVCLGCILKHQTSASDLPALDPLCDSFASHGRVLPCMLGARAFDVTGSSPRGPPAG